MRHWTEDDLTPRLDVLVELFGMKANHLPISHPEWFRRGDVVRVGNVDLEPTGEFDEWGNEILRARNEAVKVTCVRQGRVYVKRELGANGSQAKPAGELVCIVGTVP